MLVSKSFLLTVRSSSIRGFASSTRRLSNKWAAKNLLQDSFSSSRIIEILLQSYNGLSEFGTKTPDLEFAMNLLDHIMQERKHSVRLETFLYKLDNA